MEYRLPIMYKNTINTYTSSWINNRMAEECEYLNTHVITTWRFKNSVARYDNIFTYTLEWSLLKKQ